jgi:hypothetical protein
MYHAIESRVPVTSTTGRKAAVAPARILVVEDERDISALVA